MPALVAGIHAFVAPRPKAWMAGTSPAMTPLVDGLDRFDGPFSAPIFLRYFESLP